MYTFLRDVRHGLRLMAASPGVSAVAVIALALGIGANTAIFSVVNAVLLRTVPVADPDRVVRFVNHHPARKAHSDRVLYAEVCQWRRASRCFESIAVVEAGSANLAVGDGEPERVAVSKVSGSFFAMAGVRPMLGRGFLPEEDRPGARRVAVLSYEFWKRRFAASPGVAGATVALDGEPHAVVGVLPPRFRFLGPRSDVYTPAALPEEPGARACVNAYGRLKRNIPPAQLQAELDAMTAGTRARLPAYKDWHIRTGPLTEWIDTDVKVSLWVLLGAVGLVLLMACANVAGLLLSRAAARRREIAVRAAMGAGRARLTLQMVAESMPLAAIGAAAGLLLAWWAVDLLRAFDLSRIQRLEDARIDGAVLAFTAAVSVLSCLLFALAPAVSFSAAGIAEALKESARSASGSLRGARLRGALVAVEVGLAVLLSIGATLMIRTFFSLSAVNPGFHTENLLTAQVELPRAAYRSRESVDAFYTGLAARLRALPGVQGATLTNSMPLGGNYLRATAFVEGRENQPGDLPIVNFRAVDHAYFQTLRITLLKGRAFNERDRHGSPPVMIVNQTTARRYFPGEDPVGRRMGSPGEWYTVVGVVADVKHSDVAMAPGTEILLPFPQAPSWSAGVMVRLDPAVYPDPLRFAPLLRGAVRDLDPHQAVYRVAAMDRIMADRLSPRKLNMALLAAFAGLAMLLAAVGIYGVLSFAVERRTHEIGIRMALGARAGDVVRMVTRQALVMVLAGMALGLAGAAALTRFLRSILHGVEATDPVTFAGAALLLAAVAALATWLPARRATRVDPVTALRWE